MPIYEVVVTYESTEYVYIKDPNVDAEDFVKRTRCLRDVVRDIDVYDVDVSARQVHEPAEVDVDWHAGIPWGDDIPLTVEEILIKEAEETAKASPAYVDPNQLPLPIR